MDFMGINRQPHPGRRPAGEQEDALRKSEQHFRDLVEMVGIGILVDDEDGHYVYFNDHYAQIFGYSTEEMKRQTIWTILHPDDIEMVRAYHRGRLKGMVVPSRYELRGIRKDGSIVHLEADVTVLEEGGRPVGTRSCIWDITKRKLAEKRRRESDARFRAVVEHSHDGILILDHAHHVVYANTEASRISGYSHEEIIGRDFRMFLDKESLDLVSDLYLRRQKGEQVPARYEFGIVAKNGERRRIEISSSTGTNAAGSAETIAQLRDITERKTAERERQINEARLQSLVEILRFPDSNGRAFLDFVMDKAIGMTDSRLGYIFFYHDDRRQFVLNSWSREAMKECTIPNPRMVYDLDKTGVWGEAVRQERAIVINDYEALDPLKKGYPEGHAKIRNFMTVPVSSGGRIVAVLGLANKETGYTDTDVLQTTLLMDTAWEVLERRQAEEARRRIEWMLTPDHRSSSAPVRNSTLAESRKPSVGNLAALNTSRIILGALGSETLQDIVRDYVDLLDTSIVVHEGNGDYAHHVSSSSWCRFLRQASRKLCGTADDREALAGGRWLCHESCGTGCSKIAIQTGKPVDAACAGGIRAYAVPIRAGDQIIGAVKIGYGDPPLDRAMLPELAAAYGVTAEELSEHAAAYESRPPFIIDMAKRRLEASARLIGEIVERTRAVGELKTTLENLRKIVGATVQAIATAVESRDPYTAGHQRRVADLARAIAAQMGLPQDQIEGIRTAGVIHDLGKLSVPAEILSKPTRLTALEFALIQTHSQQGYEILKDISFPWPVARMVLEHHERLDGSGYPQGLEGDQILIESRILAVADVVEAIASHRPYRPAKGTEAALQEIVANRGRAYDAGAVDACLKVFENGYQFPEMKRQEESS